MSTTFFAIGAVAAIGTGLAVFGEVDEEFPKTAPFIAGLGVVSAISLSIGVVWGMIV